MRTPAQSSSARAPRPGRGAAPPAAPRVATLPVVAGVFLLLLLVVSLHLSTRLRGALESQLSGQLRVSAELAAGAIADTGDADLAPGGSLLTRLEEIRRATSVSEIWLYDTDGRLLGGSTTGNAAGIVPSRVWIGDPGERKAADPALRVPARDAAGGLSLLVPLARDAGAGALLARLDRESQGGLATIDFLFSVAKGLAGVMIAAGLLVLLRWGAHGPGPAASSGPVASSDVDLVLGTVRQVMTTLKDSESEYRDRMTAAEADADRWRLTNDQIVRSLGSAIVAFDSDGNVTLFNPAAEKLLGTSALRARGRPVVEILGGREGPLAKVAMRLLHSGRPESRAEMAHAVPGDEPCWIGVTSSVLRADDGSGVGGILLMADLTETKRLRDQMKLKDRLSAVGEMSAGIAHEIKNSLHALMGSANLLREDFQDDPPLAVRSILDEVAALQTMVQGILEFSRPAVLVPTPTDLGGLLREIAQGLAGAAEKAGVSVRVEAEADMERVEVDGDSVRRAFLNLALNAVEAMEGAGAGGTLTMSARAAEGTGEEVRVSFRDTGPGIPESDRASIFTPFYTTKRDGSGLGLALAHKTVTDHGGRIQLLSREGVGTEFVVLLPRKAPEPHALPSDERTEPR